MSRATDAAAIDSDWSTLAGAISSYLADGGNPAAIAGWLLSQIKQTDNRVAAYLIQSGNRAISSPPERRTFAAADWG